MPSCIWTKKKKNAIVESCALEAQKDSAFCPRHTFLYNLAEKEKYDQDKLRRDENAAKLENRTRRTRVQHCAAGFIFQGSSVCRCGKLIEWWRTPNLRNAPYDPMPEETSIAVSHFVTCSHKSIFRKAS